MEPGPVGAGESPQRRLSVEVERPARRALQPERPARYQRLDGEAAPRERLRRAIINTIRNAYQAASQAGREGCVTLRMFAQGDERVVEVADQGPGISEEKLAEILRRKS